MMAAKGLGRVVTVKEMADEIGFSQEFLSKAMQSLKRAGIASRVAVGLYGRLFFNIEEGFRCRYR